MVTLKLNRYDLDMTKPADVAEHKRIREVCKGLGYRCFEVLAMRDGKEPPDTVILEPEHLFDNQCNASGFRVFDWYQGVYPNPSITRGYYLTGDTAELRAMRERRYKCGWCGNQHDGHDAPITCSKCLGGPHLTEDRLHLLTMQPLIGPRRPESMPDKAAYQQAQEEARAAFIIAQQQRRLVLADKEEAEAKDKAAAVIEEARIKALTLRAGLDVDNLIYYSHKKEWVWGWREPMTQEQSERIRAIELPFNYTIKMRDGTAR